MKKITWLAAFIFMVVAGYSWATVSTTTTRIQYSCNGSTTNFTYPFKVYEDDDLDVFKTDSSNVETTLILNTEYTVSGAGDASGGTVTLAGATTCASGYTLTFLRNIDFTQDTDYSDGSAITADGLETPNDKSRIIDQKSRIIDQQINEKIGRSIKVAKSSTLTDLSVIPAANQAIFFDSAGTGLETRAPGSTTLAVPADESVTAAKLSTADVAAINAKLGTDAWLFNDAYIIVGSVTGADYASLAAYLADSPAAGDHVIVAEDQTVITRTVIPDDITLQFAEGADLITLTNITSAVVEFGDNGAVEGVLNVYLNHTGTIATAVRFNGDNTVGKINVENASTGTLTTAYQILASKTGNNVSGFTSNSGGGTLTTIIDDSSTEDSNYFVLVDASNNILIRSDGAKTFSDDVIFNGTVTANEAFSAISTVSVSGVLTADGGVKSDGANTLKTTIVEIGDWDMDANQSATPSIGVTNKNIRSVFVVIRNDSDSTYLPLNSVALGASAVAGGINSLATNFVLTRATGGSFDNVNYDSTSYNRGWITITYVP
jgi:hypothetical protein